MDDSDVYPKLSEQAYWEYNPDSANGYYYYVQLNKYDYHITPDGVSICQRDGSSILTYIDPSEIFGKTKMLTDEQLCFIIAQPIEGEKHSAEEMAVLYKEYLAQK